MNITTKSLVYAIHRVLAAQGVSTGCSVDMPQMLDGWRETLLRKRDLIEGLETLRKSGHVALEQTPQGPRIRLLHDDFGLVRTKEDHEALAVLNRLRLHRQKPKRHLGTLLGKTVGRRSGDPAATQA